MLLYEGGRIHRICGFVLADAALDGHTAVYAWGANEYGQLGLGDVSPRAFPIEIKVGHRRVSVLVLAMQFFLDWIWLDGWVWT